MSELDPDRLVIATLSERPDLLGKVFGPEIKPPCRNSSALSPVHVSLEQDHAVYVEPNLWVRHPLD